MTDGGAFTGGATSGKAARGSESGVYMLFMSISGFFANFGGTVIIPPGGGLIPSQLSHTFKAGLNTEKLKAAINSSMA